MTLVPKVLELLEAEGAGDLLVVVGGTIPADDAAALLDLGVGAVYTPGQPVAEIVEYLQAALADDSTSSGR